MAAELVQIGPFIGGLNTASDPSTIADNELAYLVNLELEVDGALRVRPLDYSDDKLPNIPGDASSKLRILGYYNPLGIAAPILIATNGVNTYSLNWHAVSPAWIQIANYPASDIAQFRDRLYLLVPLGNGSTPVYKSGYNTGTGVFDTNTTQAGMPEGSRIISFKDRLWIIHGKSATTNGARLYVSDFNTGTPVIWSSDFVNINVGDGQNNVDIRAYSQDIVIFKEDSTFRFSYNNIPGDGAITLVSESVGAESSACVVPYENSLFVLYQSKVYEFSNYQFTLASQKINLNQAISGITGLVDAINLSVWDDRLFVSFEGALYVMSLLTRTWSIWQMGRQGVRVWPITTASSDFPEAIISGRDEAGGATAYRTLRRISSFTGIEPDDYDLIPFYCTLATKKYSYNNPSVFKRLFSWGLDGLVACNVDEPDLSASFEPTSAASPLTWAEMALNTWAYASSFTWRTPGVKNLDQSVYVTIPGTTPAMFRRKFVRFPRVSTRFREASIGVQFKIPERVMSRVIRIYSLSTRVEAKANVRYPVN